MRDVLLDMLPVSRIVLCVAAIFLLAGAGCGGPTGSESEGWAFAPDAAPLDEVPDSRMENLTRGINLSHWFSQAELTSNRFATFITEDDVRSIREMGFRHVRLPLDPDVLFVPSNPAILNQQYVGYFDDAVQMILDEGLAVVVDLHPQSDFKARLESDVSFVESVGTFWNALAHHLHPYDPERVFLEVMNEPEFESAEHWQRVQSRLVEAMRAGAPRHTIVATGPMWSAADQLPRIERVDDPNVVYNFHLYDPHTFTHQGATWGFEAWQHFHGLPYPSSPEAVEPVLPELDERVRQYVRDYGEERWNRDRLEAWIRRAVDWAERHGVRLTCNEFGVYRRVAPPEHRLAWLRDARTLFEEYGIGWAMWDYAGGFSVVDGPSRTPDAGTVEALGLGGEG